MAVKTEDFENNPKGVGRGSYNQGQNKTFHSQYQDGSKPTTWDTTFQAYDIDSKSLLEELKKLAVCNTLKQNGPEKNYSRWLMQYNPNPKGKFNSNAKQETRKQVTKEDKATAKEIAEAFSAVTGQEISKEEVSLIQDIQLPGDEEVDNQTEDVEASEGENTEA